MEILAAIILPIAAYILVSVVGALISDGKIWPERNDDGTTGAIGVWALLLITPTVIIFFEIPKQYYWHSLIGLIVITNLWRIYKKTQATNDLKNKSNTARKNNSPQISNIDGNKNQQAKNKHNSSATDESPENWVYSAAERRLYNTNTGENLHASSGLGFSIGESHFLLYNKEKVRKIKKDQVFHK